MSEFYIQGVPYSFTEIERLAQDDFTLQRIQTMPSNLYKYFPNTIDLESGRNYSKEALENNTVYLQQPFLFDDPYDSTILIDEQEFAHRRIAYYARICGLEILPEWDYSKIAYEFSCYLYEKLMSGEQLADTFPTIFHSKDMLELRHENFALNLQIGLHEFCQSPNAWEQAFHKAIHQEYTNLLGGLIQKFRISCFTESPYSMLMWAYYANNHKGFCIEYEIPSYTEPYIQLFHNLMPVIYSDERISVLNQCIRFLQEPGMTPDVLWDIYKYGLLMKDTAWKYQNEWRLISYDDMLSNDNFYNCRFFKIKRVFLGNRMTVSDRMKIISICKDKKIPYIGVTVAPDKYRMVDCEQLCEACPKFAYSKEVFESP